MDADLFAQLLRRLRGGGYQKHAPGEMASDLDGANMATAVCVHCLHIGLTYRPFTWRSSYRALVVCPACGRAEEF